MNEFEASNQFLWFNFLTQKFGMGGGVKEEKHDYFQHFLVLNQGEYKNIQTRSKLFKNISSLKHSKS